MANRVYHMSLKEVGRLEVIQQIESKKISQIAAAQQLELSTRHIRDLQKSYRKHGAPGLISKRRGKPSNNQTCPAKLNKALALLKSDYVGFGPTFAAEKLVEHHGIKISVETLRQMMIKHQLWQPKQRRQVKHHQMRTRRSSFGELVQIDGSPHDWFEGRADSCCLLVFIDDATSRLVEMLFLPQETTQGYFDATENYIQRHGRPIAFYSDKHSIFRINTPEVSNSTGETQFARALRELDIELICAHSPQAKGRVERANKTLQDRLVKEMRLRGISSIEEANAYLPEFMTKHNQRFAIEPASHVDAHRKPLPKSNELKLIFSHQATRTLSKNLECSYNNVIYQIQTQSKSYAMRGTKVKVSNRKGEIKLIYKNNVLTYKTFDKNNRPTEIVDSKQLNQHLDEKIKKAYKPKDDHPWRRAACS